MDKLIKCWGVFDLIEGYHVATYFDEARAIDRARRENEGQPTGRFQVETHYSKEVGS